VRVPDAVFAGAQREHACGSVLAVRELEGYLPLHIYVPGPLARMAEPQRRRRKQALIARLVDVARRLHGRNYFHRDFYLCHFFLRDDAAAPDGFDLVLIDFGRLLHSRLGRWRTKDLAALLFSTFVPGVSRTDRMRFYKQYLGIAKLDDRAKQAARRIMAKAERYRRHNYGRRAA
jgi:heptose I phosphotransferase